MNIRSVGLTLDVKRAQAELAAHPGAWGQYRWRTEHPRSPHRECSDIWMRYNALENLGPRFNDEHEAVWYPIASELPACRELATEVFALSGADHLGGVLITKVPAGKRVYPHADRGWHAESHEKWACQLAAHALQAFCFRDLKLSPAEGELYTFNNQSEHWVVNDSDEDRITLIVCVRRQ